MVDVDKGDRKIKVWLYLLFIVCHIQSEIRPRELQVDVDGDARVRLHDVGDVVDPAVHLRVEERLHVCSFWSRYIETKSR